MGNGADESFGESMKEERLIRMDDESLSQLSIPKTIISTSLSLS
jgi:hypothetical protein